jgi:ABC-type bacteriocin/lantibiotic exporter with double-glycine peptidase domain
MLNALSKIKNNIVLWIKQWNIHENSIRVGLLVAGFTAKDKYTSYIRLAGQTPQIGRNQAEHKDLSIGFNPTT